MWTVWEEDSTGGGVLYRYKTRREQRAHMRRVQDNPFLKGWLVRAGRLGLHA